jgi:hypothetical protein
VEKAEDYIIDDERLCTFIDDDECRATFVYGYHNATGRLQVWVQTTKECPVVVDIMGNPFSSTTRLQSAMDKFMPTGQNLGRIFNCRCGDACAYHAIMLVTKTTNLKVENAA